MDAAASASHSNLLEPYVLEFTHLMEVWYVTALQAQGDADAVEALAAAAGQHRAAAAAEGNVGGSSSSEVGKWDDKVPIVTPSSEPPAQGLLRSNAIAATGGTTGIAKRHTTVPAVPSSSSQQLQMKTLQHHQRSSTDTKNKKRNRVEHDVDDVEDSDDDAN